jgi:hypothetical protein
MILSDYKKELPSVIYILGSGGSLDLYPENYWKDKFTVGVNKLFKFIDDLDALVFADWGLYIQEAIDTYDADIFISRYNCSLKRKGLNKFSGDAYVYDHLPNTGISLLADMSLMDNPKDNHVITCGDSICRAIGLFVYLGVKEIRLAGCDGDNIINGNVNIKGYYDKSISTNATIGHAKRSMKSKAHMIEGLKKYGINIEYINP